MRAWARQHKRADPLSYLRNPRQRPIALRKSRCPIKPRQPRAPKRASASNCYGSIMVTFEVGPPEDPLLATAAAAEVPELTAATATLRPLASTAELASVTITRIRTFCIAGPFRSAPAHQPGNHALSRGSDNNSLTGTKGDGQRSALAVSAGGRLHLTGFLGLGFDRSGSGRTGLSLSAGVARRTGRPGEPGAAGRGTRESAACSDG